MFYGSGPTNFNLDIMKSGTRLVAVSLFVMLLANPWHGKAGNRDFAPNAMVC